MEGKKNERIPKPKASAGERHDGTFKKKPSKNEIQENPEKESLTAKKEALYSAEEFAACAGTLFGNRVTKELVEAALEQAGKQRTTITQAKQIVEKFKIREVI